MSAPSFVVQAHGLQAFMRRLPGWGFAWLFGVAALLAAAPAMAADWAARHGLTAAQYQSAFEDLADKGFRLTAVSGYESNGGARYAALWVKKAGPAWSARHGLSPQQYQTVFDEQVRKGFRLSFVNGYSVDGKAFYAGIWTKGGGPAWTARHGLTADQYQQAVSQLSDQGYSLRHVSAFAVDGEPRFAAIFEKGGPAWVARHGLSADEYQDAFNQFDRQGYVLKVVSGYRDGGSTRYAALWTKTESPPWSARHGIPAAHYQAVFDNHRFQSDEPIYIQAFNSGNGVRFNGIWQNTAFQPRDLALIRDKARAYMRDNNMPGLSIAIMKDEKLVYAAGFGLADKDSEQPVGPMHRFRVASVSKPITRIAVMKLVNDTPLNTDSKLFGAGSELGSQFATPAGNRKIEDITVQHLLGHRGGFVNVNKNGDASDPMFDYSGSTHKGLIEWTLSNYPLGFDPGSDSKYSNFGYCLLGRVIEARSGKRYEAYVRDAILKPAGAPDIVIGGNEEDDRLPGEVVYYGGGAYSSVKPERFDSHGGWIARPMDLLRVLKHETVLETSYGHYGEMSGTTSVLRRRNDGFGMAAASNSNNDSTEAMNQMLKEIVEGVSRWPQVNLF